jgi:putative membrane-bound dehydrogenase-like protein
MVLLLALLGFTFRPAQEGFAASVDANRLTYLDENDPFYPHVRFPKLTTPQWIGEPGVEAVVILSIDDMRETGRYETFLRPILERLKQIDGRAPVSIMVNAVTPTNAQLQAWLKEGLSLEVHTLAHPCPCLAKGDFTAAANTYHGCVELMNQVPGNKPVAFRMPCCDSMNSPSPRFYAEIFNRTNSAGQFLTIDSSVMCLLTTNDPALPRELVMDADGREKFRKYFPAETNATTKVNLKNFATTIEDYPYPYVIGKLCWEFPAMVPSDWEAFNVIGPTNATLLADWKSALDAVVLKQGVFSFIFHPHGWSSPRQFVEFIDHAVAKHGTKVKFLTFREAQERLDRNMLRGHPLRSAQGSDHGVGLLDADNDGYMDVLIGYDEKRSTRLWDATRKRWNDVDLPASFQWPQMIGPHMETGIRAGVLRADGRAELLSLGPLRDGAWLLDGQQWVEDKLLRAGLELDGQPIHTKVGRDLGVRFRDIDHDGVCELIVSSEKQNAVFAWSDGAKSWKKLAYALPPGTSIVDAEGRDAGLRFVDVNGDGYDDVLFSNEERFSLHLFVPKANPRLMWEVGWNDQVWSGKRGESDLNIPRIVRAGTNRNNGVWFKNGAMWIQNEDTANLPDKVDRRTFRELLTADQPPPLSPEQSLAAFRLRPGFKAEIAAAEPLVLDPIAFEWGADGRLWVVDMFDYPLGRVEPGASQPTRSPHGEEILTPPQGGRYVPGGRIKVLEDTDGDGRYDKATVFLDNVNFPTGILPWRNGVLVAAAPEIFYAEDTDGDGKADKRQTLFTGFVEGNQQHRVNGFDYGLDNWVYGANGDSGGLIRSELKPSFPMVNMRGHDFRFRPDTGDFETVAGGTQFGRHRDDWGNWFGNNNSVWLWHYYLPEQYVERNPHLAVKSTKQMLANYPESGRIYPASRTRQRFNDFHHFNHVTSANSPTPYRDDLFGPEFATSVFISDPVHNVVHREVLQPDGVSFTSHRAAGETNSEFVASADPWFRPTMLKTGPDGALYIADMYRLVIEHPEWIPKWVQARLDLRAGSDQGRIYRIAPKSPVRRQIPNLARLDTAGLVAALDSPNGWQRDTAQRLLVERQDKAAVEELKRLCVEAAGPKVRLQALCTLDGLSQLAPELLKLAFRDPHPAVREQAVRLAEKFAETFDFEMQGASGSPQFSSLINDPDLRVRNQLAFTLGAPGWKSDRPGFLLSRLALSDFEQPGMQTAILSSAPRYVDQMLAEVFSRDSGGAAPAALIEQLLGLAAALNQHRAIASALEAIAHSPASRNVAWRFNALAGLLDGLERRNRTLRQFATECGPEVQALAGDLEKLLPIARKAAVDEGTREPERLAAIRLLARDPERREEDFKRLGGLLAARYSSAIQRAALIELARQKERPAADALLAGWNGFSPAMRTDALNVLLGRPDWCRALLAVVQKGDIPPGQIGAAFQEKLLNHPDQTVKKRAADLFTTTSTDRGALLQQYSGVAKLTGDAGKGMSLFRQQCATCHKLRGEGNDVGPDLATLAGKDVPTLLLAILDPNQTVEVRYVNYTAVTKNEREISGILTAETANSITLRAPGGREETLLRSDLSQFTSSGLSLMPDGLEKALTPQDMADLLAALLGK